MRLTDLLAELAAAESGLAELLARLADDHRADQDVSYVAVDLAQWSREHAAALAERAGVRLPDIPPGVQATRDPEAALLRDLREVYTAACGVASDWDVLRQAARARHDDDLVALVGLCAPRNQRQVTWLRAERKTLAAQVVRH
jgi:hypothetical protein